MAMGRTRASIVPRRFLMQTALETQRFAAPAARFSRLLRENDASGAQSPVALFPRERTVWGLRRSRTKAAGERFRTLFHQRFGGVTPGVHRRRGSELELWQRFITFPPCRFTNFIAPNASGTAKSWSGRANGRGPSVPIAVPPSSPRSCPCSRRRAAAARAKRPNAATGRVLAGVAAGVHLDTVLGVY